MQPYGMEATTKAKQQAYGKVYGFSLCPALRFRSAEFFSALQQIAESPGAVQKSKGVFDNGFILPTAHCPLFIVNHEPFERKRR